MSEDTGSCGRRRRDKIEKSGRSAAFEKLKKLKGSKHKYEVTEFENVYEEVDEKEYSKRVLARQDDDWIVDDDGTGYVEDGREIFDDDLDDESIFQASRKKKRSSDHGNSKRARLGNLNGSEKSSNIRSMLMYMPAKKEAPVNLDDDEILNDIMQELHGKKASEVENTNHTAASVETAEESAMKYIKTLTEMKPKPVSLNLAKKFINKKIDKQQISEKAVLIERDDVLCASMFHEDFTDAVEVENKAPIVSNEVSEEAVCSSMFNEDFSDAIQPEEETNDQLLKNNQINGEEVLNSVSEEVKPLDKLDEVRNNDVPLISSEPLSSTYVSVSHENLPLVKDAEGNKVLRFFWLDVHEEPFKQPGVIFLFGKVWIESARVYVSCCVAVHNVERKILVLPKEKMATSNGGEKDVTFLDVYNEFSKIASNYGIMEFRSRKVEMHNCFNPDIPHTSEYMEVKYSAHSKMLPSDLKGNTFSHVFGIGTSALERFLVERRIKGPCWLDVHQAAPVNNCLSWCKVEMSVEKMELVSVTVTAEKILPPPVVLLALQIKTIVNSKSNQNEVALVVGLVNRDFPLNHEPPTNKQFSQHFSILAPLSIQPYPFDVRECTKQQDGIIVERMDSERALLSNLLAKVQRLDPDFIVGYDVLGFDLEVIVQRLLLHKVTNWSRLGRLRRHFPTPAEKKRMSFTKSYLCGRLPCDVMLAAKEHVQNVRSYDLETLCSSVLDKETQPALTFEEVRQHYDSGYKLKSLIKQTLLDAANALQIMCQISAIPLALQITNIAGNVMSRTLIGGRAERNEYLLLHAFQEKNYIPPEKISKRLSKNLEEVTESNRDKLRKKPNYSGGLVLEPKKGLYDQMVLVMDFNSLYPSIIMEYNICFTTVSLTASADENFLPDVPSKDLEVGILPSEIRKLVENRVLVRKMMQDGKLTPLELAQLHTRQIALKLMANSMYGCLGFSHARFYAKPLAALITAKGREILMKTKEYVESMNYEVVYGDTDSIMINTNSFDFEEVMKIGKQILQSVNKLYRCVNLDIDGVYKYMLLLKKKKYAVKQVTRLPDGSLKTKTILKGLDIVRRDWSRIAIESGNFVVEQILSDSPLEDKLVRIGEHLKRLGEDLCAGHVPLPLLTISKQLTKSLNQYSDDKSQPHVLVAKRLFKKGMCRMKAGDTVSYVICEDGTSNTPVQRAYHLDELKVDKNLKVDYKYYLAHQIHPVVTRLLDPVEDIDACRIAEFLGLDPSPYQQALRQQALNNGEEETMPSSDWILQDPHYYEKCEKFSFTCVHCKTENVMDKPFKKDDGGNLYPVLSRCSNSECTVQPTQYLSSLQNRLSFLLRSNVQQYYEGTLICEDPACPQRTQFVPFNFHRAYPVCFMCKSAVMYKEVTDKDLYTQLFFFKLMFDIRSSPDYKSSINVTSQVEAAYNILHNQVTSHLNHSLYSKVELGSIFEFCNAKMSLNIKKALTNGVASSVLQHKHLGINKAQ